jgi:hypothetical protein
MIAPPDEVPPMARQAVVPEQTIWESEVTLAPAGMWSDTKVWADELTVPAMRTGVVAVLPVPMARQAVVPEQTIWESEVTLAPAGMWSDTKVWADELTVPAMRTGVVAVLPVPMARQAVVPEQTIWVSEVTPDGTGSDTKVWADELTVPAITTGVVAVLPMPMARQAVPEQTIWESEVTVTPGGRVSIAFHVNDPLLTLAASTTAELVPDPMARQVLALGQTTWVRFVTPQAVGGELTDHAPGLEVESTMAVPS